MTEKYGLDFLNDREVMIREVMGLIENGKAIILLTRTPARLWVVDMLTTRTGNCPGTENTAG